MPDTPSLQSRLNRIWYAGEGGLWLRPLAALYGLLVAARRGLYRLGVLRSERLAVPVIVVGNLTVGGTGKTPLTAYLAAELRALGRRPGIASRGHGRQGASVLQVTGRSTAAEVGDEPLLLARRTGVPVAVGRRRVAVVQRLIRSGCDIVLCDDGLQHLALARDLEIAVVDAARGLGNGRLLPAGPLREAPSRLGEVDCVVVNASGGNGAGFKSQGALQMRLVGETAYSCAGEEPRALEQFRGQQVHAVAGIGNPARFFAQLRQAGLELLEHPFNDHHAFVAADLAFGDDRAVLMTEKDAVKCEGFAEARFWFVPVEAHFGPEDRARLLALLSALPRPGE